MSRRAISDHEISLIKAMLSRGMKNKDIQFFFNRPDRPVNTGRISTIRAGTYSNSANIPAAADAELDSFVTEFRNNQFDPPRRNVVEASPVERARTLFVKRSNEKWYLIGGEGEESECKLDFNLNKMAKTVRSVAAMANNKGGYIFFGVSNLNCEVLGVGNTFAETDVVQIIAKVKAHLSPTPTISYKGSIEFGDKQVGFLRVEKHSHRPVIVYRDGDGLNEGEILFRYPGESSRIKFGDLITLLDERDRQAQFAMASATQKIAEVGTSNAMILDTDKNVLEGGGQRILIDKELVNQIKFIKEGEFSEKLGAPTLKLIGEVSATTISSPSPERAPHGAIFQEQILEEFLAQSKINQPLHYIQSGLAQSRSWLPIFYFARQVGWSNNQVAEWAVGLKNSPKVRKERLIERLRGKRSALTSAVTQSSKTIAANISGGLISAPSSVAEVSAFAFGLTAVKETTSLLEEILVALRSSWKLAIEAEDSNAISAVFKGACRVDEMFFGCDN